MEITPFRLFEGCETKTQLRINTYLAIRVEHRIFSIEMPFHHSGQAMSLGLRINLRCLKFMDEISFGLLSFAGIKSE